MQAARGKLQNGLKSRFVHGTEEGWFNRCRLRRAGLAIQERHFAEEASSLDKAECLLLPATARLRVFTLPSPMRNMQSPVSPSTKNNVAGSK